ncbi:MAG: Ig-like domain-containing protein, partial [Thermoplasmata archaeon]|nr:Ig-like domain-containing protein [Thermoplasmata archaeon]
TLTPTTPLSYSTQYNVTLDADVVKDQNGLYLDGNENGTAEGSPVDKYTWSFTTELEPDTTPPTITINSPTGSDVALDAVFSVTFDENMNQTQAESAFIIAPAVAGAFSWDGNTLTFTPTTPIPYSTTYTIRINASVARDLAGNRLDGDEDGTSELYPVDDFWWTFTTIQESTPPAKIWDLSATPGDRNGEIDLSWTAPGDDGNTSKASAYEIRYYGASINDMNWASATLVAEAPTPQNPGTQKFFTVTGLTPGQTYYFAIKTLDEVPNISPLSNTASAVATDLKPPTTPATVIPTTSDEGIALTWTASTEEDFDHYAVYRSTDNIIFVLVVNTTDSSYTDTDVEDGTIYYYEIVAVDEEGNEAPGSTTVQAVWETPTVQSPAEPSSSPFLIIIVLIVLAAIGVLGYLFWQKKLKGDGMKPKEEVPVEDGIKEEKVVPMPEAEKEKMEEASRR